MTGMISLQRFKSRCCYDATVTATDTCRHRLMLTPDTKIATMMAFVDRGWGDSRDYRPLKR
eukprot:2646610-Rhodomonas_salina.2